MLAHQIIYDLIVLDTPTPNKNYTAIGNGCGSKVSIDFDRLRFYGFNQCCFGHDT